MTLSASPHVEIETLNISDELTFRIDKLGGRNFGADFDEFVLVVVTAGDDAGAQRFPVSVVMLQFVNQREKLWLVGEISLYGHRTVVVVAYGRMAFWHRWR